MAMKLQSIEADGLRDLEHVLLGLVDKHADRHNPFWQSPHDLARLGGRNISRAARKEVEAQEIGARLDGASGVQPIGNTADLHFYAERFGHDGFTRGAW